MVRCGRRSASRGKLQRFCFAPLVAIQGQIRFWIGAKGPGEVRFLQVGLEGYLDPKWVRRVQARVRSTISIELRKLLEKDRPAMPIA